MQTNASSLSAWIHINFGHRARSVNAHTEVFGYLFHGFHNFVHASFWVPGTQPVIGMIHEDVKRGSIFGLSPQKEHRKF